MIVIDLARFHLPVVAACVLMGCQSSLEGAERAPNGTSIGEARSPQTSREGSSASRQRETEVSAFARTVANIANRAARIDSARLELVPVRTSGFAFYDDGRLEAIRCAQAVTFGVIANSSIVADLTVGVCAGDDASRAQRLAESAPEALRALREIVKKALLGVKNADVEPGWRYVKSAGPNGSTLHLFPLPWVSHGIGVLHSAVLVSQSGEQAILVQASVDGICGGARPEPTYLCENTLEAIGEIARQIFVHGEVR